jgi:hypothetical protein
MRIRWATGEKTTGVCARLLSVSCPAVSLLRCAARVLRLRTPHRAPTGLLKTRRPGVVKGLTETGASLYVVTSFAVPPP